MTRIAADDRRELFVNAAIRVIGREGVARATTRRIASEAGLSQASLGYVYRGKEELFFEVLDAGTRRFHELLSEIDKDAGLPRTTEWLMYEVFDWFVAEGDLFHAMFELLIWAWHHDEDMTAAREVYDTYIGLAAEVLRAAVPAGDALDVMPLARCVIAALDGVYLQYVTYGDLASARASYSHFVASSVALASQIEQSSRLAVAVEPG